MHKRMESLHFQHTSIHFDPEGCRDLEAAIRYALMRAALLSFLGFRVM